MSALIRIYDEVTSNKYVSLGITTCVMARSFYRTYQDKNNFQSILFTASTCAGFSLAILTNNYLVKNAKTKNSGERNTIYSTCSLFIDFNPVTNIILYKNVLFYTKKIFSLFETYPRSSNFINGLSLGFTATNLVLQLTEKANRK